MIELHPEILKKNGKKVFLNSADALLKEHAAVIEQITYSAKKDFCFCQLVGSDPFLKIKYEGEVITSHLIGRYNFENIAAAICIGKYFGVEVKKIKEAIEKYVPSNNRSQVLKTKTNTLILDAYNANPSSMRAAIENFYEMEGDNLPDRQAGKWLILGDMRELGVYEIQEHKDILQLIADKKFQNVVLVGEKFSQAFAEMKLKIPAELFKNSDELVTKMKDTPLSKEPALILIKGSRGIKLEKVVEYL